LEYDDEAKTPDAKANDGTLDPHLVIRDGGKSGVKKMICGGMGPHAYQVAQRFSVEVLVASSITVAEALKLAVGGELSIAAGPTAHDHHDHGDHHNDTRR
jgi:predicted Fe-Mo cluster-binding NifX family protein